MEQAPHGTPHGLGMGPVHRRGAQKYCFESEPVGRPQDRPQVVGIVDPVQKQDVAGCMDEQVQPWPEGFDPNQGHYPFRFPILAESFPFPAVQQIEPFHPRASGQIPDRQRFPDPFLFSEAEQGGGMPGTVQEFGYDLLSLGDEHPGPPPPLSRVEFGPSGQLGFGRSGKGRREDGRAGFHLSGSAVTTAGIFSGRKIEAITARIKVPEMNPNDQPIGMWKRSWMSILTPTKMSMVTSPWRI